MYRNESWEKKVAIYYYKIGFGNVVNFIRKNQKGKREKGFPYRNFANLINKVNVY